MQRSLLALAVAFFARGAVAKGTNLCVLYVADTIKGFHLGRVDFAAKAVVDLLTLPLTLTGAGGGVAAGADDGQFFIPNADVAYNDLLEVNLATNTTTSHTIAAPAGFSGVPAFYTVSLNIATGDLFALFEESTRIAWVAAATVYPANGTSVALTGDFASAWIADFPWRKVGCVQNFEGG